MRPHADLLLGSRYRLSERIATGGMGEVWRAGDDVLGRDVAVKVLKDEFVDDATFLARFRAEARSAARLAHPGIAQVFDYAERGGPDGRTAYLVMELVPGEPLSTLLAREKPLLPARALDLLAQCADALQAAHDGGVVHRDIKPSNLLVTPAGSLCVTDFGIARAADAAPLTMTGTVMGTAHYLSPEQASGRRVTTASDIYSLGVVAYECLAGHRPHEGKSPVAVAMAHVREEPPPLPERVPAPVRDLVMACLAKSPADRPPSAAVLAASARRLGADRLVGVGAASAAARTVPAAVPPTPASTGQHTHVLAAVGADLRGPSSEPGVAPLSRGRGRALAAAVLAVVAAALITAGFAVDPADDSGKPPAGNPAPAPARAAPAKPATVQVDPARYRGRPFAEVRAALQQLGLKVERRNVETGGAAGTVAEVRPTRAVPVGSTVVVEVVARAGAAEPAGAGSTADGPGADGGEAAGGDNGSGGNSPNEQANEQDKKRAKKSDDDKEKPPGRGGKGRDDR